MLYWSLKPLDRSASMLLLGACRDEGSVGLSTSLMGLDCKKDLVAQLLNWSCSLYLFTPFDQGLARASTSQLCLDRPRNIVKRHVHSEHFRQDTITT